MCIRDRRHRGHLGQPSPRPADTEGLAALDDTVDEPGVDEADPAEVAPGEPALAQHDAAPGEALEVAGVEDATVQLNVGNLAVVGHAGEALVDDQVSAAQRLDQGRPGGRLAGQETTRLSPLTVTVLAASGAVARPPFTAPVAASKVDPWQVQTILPPSIFDTRHWLWVHTCLLYTSRCV